MGTHPIFESDFDCLTVTKMGCNSSKAATPAATMSEKSDCPTLYWNALSPPSRTIHQICKTLGVDVNIVALDLAGGEHKKSPYIDINPNGTVPCLVHEVLTQLKSKITYNKEI